MLTSYLKSKINALRQQNPELSFWGITMKILQSGLRILAAKYYLRNCQKVGKFVSVNGKPKIDNLGEMQFDDEVRIWSTIVKAKLYTGKKGKLLVGKNSRINGAHIDAQNLITIGDNVRIAPYTIILDSDYHDVQNPFSDVSGQPITIEDNVWIATRSTILKGVTIGRGSVIATGAVVTKDVPENCIAAGVPARVIKKIR